MFEWNEDLQAGERVVWWVDGHGRGLAPDHPDARRREGVIDQPIPHPLYPSMVIAYSVKCAGGVSGTYLVMLRPDHGHEPKRDAGDSPATQ